MASATTGIRGSALITACSHHLSKSILVSGICYFLPEPPSIAGLLAGVKDGKRWRSNRLTPRHPPLFPLPHPSGKPTRARQFTETRTLVKGLVLRTLPTFRPPRPPDADIEESVRSGSWRAGILRFGHTLVKPLSLTDFPRLLEAPAEHHRPDRFVHRNNPHDECLHGHPDPG